jgi:hypothetical protein
MRPKASTLACALLLALPGAGGAALAAPIAGQYTCAVPRALLCEGCANQLDIRLLANGDCRISFTAPSATTGASPPGAAPAQAALTFTIEQNPGAARRSAGRWRAAQARRPAPIADAKAVHARCFVFNSNQYCE